MTAMTAVSVEALAASDIATVAGWLCEPETNQWLTTEWRARTIDPVLISVAMRNKKNRFYLARHCGNPSGLVALADIDPIDKVGMIWYVLGDKTLSGRGVTTAAVRQVAEAAFRELGLECLYAWIIEDNIPSSRVLQKAGFREVGLIRGAVSRGPARLARRYFDLVRQDLA